MPDRPTQALPHLDIETEALAMLARLQRACREFDWPAAAAAERRLEELGYVVRIMRPIPRPAKAADKAEEVER